MTVLFKSTIALFAALLAMAVPSSAASDSCSEVSLTTYAVEQLLHGLRTLVSGETCVVYSPLIPIHSWAERAPQPHLLVRVVLKSAAPVPLPAALVFSAIIAPLFVLKHALCVTE
ncbi:hypothetical protein QCA50_008417 [Cerrena zonata]|uniref:Uncharacterized protein n=1 Tax=Cerrena zonata TaxID=2478898 RepID=A0AAW0GDP7_9APHY